MNAILSAFGFAISFATILGFLGSIFWVFDIFSHFRFQYFISFFIIIPFLLYQKRLKTSLVLSLFLGINIMAIYPLFIEKPTKYLKDTHRIMLLNVYSGNNEKEKVKKEIIANNPDILILQEVDKYWIKDLEWLDSLYPNSFIFPRDDNFGIALWSKVDIEDKRVEYLGSAKVPTINSIVTLGNKRVQIIATHPLPPIGKEYSRQRNEQLALLPSIINKKIPTLIVGDLNTSQFGYNFNALLKESKLQNSSNGFGFQPTWPSTMPLLYTAIDHLIHSDDILISNRKVGNNVGSDHFPLIVDFMIDK